MGVQRRLPARREPQPGEITVQCAKVDDATTRLTGLVVAERSCCPFVAWPTDTAQYDLRLIVESDDDESASLVLFEQNPLASVKESQ